MFCTNAHKIEVNKCPLCKIQELEQRNSELEDTIEKQQKEIENLKKYSLGTELD